jgi:glutamate dehydrogenase (NADP+)
MQLGAKVVTISDSDGCIYDEEGFNEEKLAFLLELKNVRRGRVSEFAQRFKSAVYTKRDKSLGYDPLWNYKADCAFPSATQNEINGKDAEHLLKNGCKLVAEGSNMSTTIEGVDAFIDAGILYAPGKAANAGGVATSGLEMTQNSMRLSWTREEVDKQLHSIMKNIHSACVKAAEAYGKPGNYVVGANVAGFLKVADAMMDQGIV